MKVLKDDVFARRPAGMRVNRRRGVGLFVFGLLSLSLLALSRIDHPQVLQVRTEIAEFAAPLLHKIAIPFAPVRWAGQLVAGYMTVAEELEAVKAENQMLKGWEARARELERRLADLSALAKVVEEPGIQFLTGRVVVDAAGPFARSLLLNSGRENGVKAGYPVVGADGLVGRVLESGARSSRILLLTDLNSRVPVLIGESSVRAILMGDNSVQPRLAHLPEDAAPKPGDEVVTSGVGGFFPRGLRIGVVDATDGGLKVTLHGRLDKLEHVSVLFFESPALELAGDLPRISGGDGSSRRSSGRPAGTGHGAALSPDQIEGRR